MTFIRAVTPLIHLSLQPVIADIDKETGNIDPEAIRANITPKTKAVVVVHMWGVPVDCEAIAKICKENNVYIIEDFSHAHFSMYKNSYVGSFGDIAFASLQRKKNVSVGEGGIIVTKDKIIYKRLQQITSPGSFINDADYANIDFSGYGLNMRMSPFGAVVVKNLLPKIDDLVKDKQKTAEVLSSILAIYDDSFELPGLPSEASSISWYSYKLKIKGLTLNDLKNLKLWKFTDFGYPAIASHPYWNKDKNFFPFSLGIKPETRLPLRGHELYLKNRITLSLPTVNATYWTQENITKWDNALKELMGSK
jgi:dTDP-4-amino-4,6-dideoxygalactose transaminase